MSGPSSCRRCHAPLPSPDADGNQVCPSCGMFHHVGDADEPAAGPIPPPPPGPFGAGAGFGTPSGAPGQGQPSPTGAAAPPPRRGPGLGCGVAAVVVIGLVSLVVVVIVAAVRSTEGPFGDAPEVTLSTGDGEVVTDAQGRPTEIVGLVRAARSSERVIARVGVDGGVAWRASIVPADVYSSQQRVTDDLVLVSLRDEIVALDGATGAVRWRVTVSDDVDARCRSCLAVFDDHLVVFSRDAFVTALALGDGSTAWSRRLESAQGEVHVVGDRLVVLDEPADPEATAALVVTDPATGDDEGRLGPSCPDPDYPTEAGHTVDFEVSSRVVAVPGTDDVVLLFGFGATCLQRWNLATQEMRWSQVIPDVSSLSDPTFTASGTDLVVSDSSLLLHVSLSEGTVSRLPVPADATPAEASVLVGSRLVTSIETTRGSTRSSLLAIDLRSKEILWQRDLPRGAEAFDLSDSRSSDTLFEGNARFVVAALDEERVALVTLASPGARLTVEGIDVANGRGGELGRGAFALRWDHSTSPSSRVEAVTGGRLVFSTDSIPQVLDLATGQVVASWDD